SKNTPRTRSRPSPAARVPSTKCVVACRLLSISDPRPGDRQTVTPCAAGDPRSRTAHPGEAAVAALRAPPPAGEFRTDDWYPEPAHRTGQAAHRSARFLTTTG